MTARLPEDVLPDRQRRALHAAAVALVDGALEALATDGDLAGATIALGLPARVSHHYSELTYRRMLIAVVCVGQGLARSDQPALGCVAEELALHMIIRHADAWLTDAEGQPAVDWGLYEDTVFEDTDFEVLYQPALDGIEDGGDISDYLGMANLHPGEWFEPFREDAAVHPYLLDNT